jgi:hypothetical protein
MPPKCRRKLFAKRKEKKRKEKKETSAKDL